MTHAENLPGLDAPAPESPPDTACASNAARQARERLRTDLLALPEAGDDRIDHQTIETLVRLDAEGFLLGPDETVPAARARGLRLCDRLDQLDGEIAAGGGARLGRELWPLAEADRIDGDWIAASDDLTCALYGFRLAWAPGFYFTAGRWRLWGGCAWADAEEGMALFLLRREFRDQDRFLIYRRAEILAHERCHLARWPFPADLRLEEFHAYRTSQSPLRRYLGNCFSGPWDAPLFAAPAFATAVAQAVRTATGGAWPMDIFWGLTVAGPAWLLAKNHVARQRYFRAEAALRALGAARPEAILFRTRWAELPPLAEVACRDALDDFVRERPDPRWRVIAKRFLDGTP